MEESSHTGNVSNPGRTEESAEVARSFKYGEGSLAEIPGILLLDNLKNGTHLEINTGEEDSEILNITGGHVCYRVNDSIFEAEITGSGIEGKRELGHAPELESAHWAFWQ
jgi:hypothetical protein